MSEMKNKKFIVAFLVATTLLSAALYLVFAGNGGKNDVAKKKPGHEQVEVKGQGKATRSPQKKLQTRRKKVEVGVAGAKPKLFDLSQDEEAGLSDILKKLLQELREASDAEDNKALFQIIARMQKSEDWPDGIPSILHEEAIEALSWIGSDALAELIRYLESGDESVREAAMDALQDMLSDPDKSDRDRSSMLKSALPFLNSLSDLDALDDIFSDIVDMRNSVQAETLIYLLENGSENVKEALKDTIEMVIGEEDSATVEKIKEWAAQEENKDDPDDEDYYGASKDADDTDADDTEKIENDSDFKD